MSRPTALLVALGALVLVLGVTPFIPRGGDDDGSAQQTGQEFVPAAVGETAGLGTMTPALRAEVNRVVDQGKALGARLTVRMANPKLTSEEALHGNRVLDRTVRTLVRCADFQGQTYCLGSGWTEDSQAEVQARMEVDARQEADRGMGVEPTGDLDPAAALAQRARMSVAARARAERAELTMAARSVAKVWLLRHDIEGEPLPPNFLAEHPEARATAATGLTAAGQPAAVPTSTPTSAPTPADVTPAATPADETPAPSPTVEPTLISLPSAPTAPPTTPTVEPTTGPVKTYDQYPDSAAILDINDVAEQERTYYCGPTAMEMIAWGWKGKLRSQDHWASKLGTTSSGTSISSMVAVTNKKTGWDQPSYAGPYVALDISHFTFDQWQLLLMKHIVDLRSPLILHVVLQKQFFPYLDHDGSGHFQVGRGYDKRGDKPDLIGYFEPWNQQRFHPDEPYISRVQWRQSYQTYRATQAHYQHDVGV